MTDAIDIYRAVKLVIDGTAGKPLFMRRPGSQFSLARAMSSAPRYGVKLPRRLRSCSASGGRGRR
jgi:hypothetical protein